MVSGSKPDRAALERRVVALQGIERLLLDQCHLAGVRLRGVGPRPVEVAVADDPASGDALRHGERLHLVTRRWGDVDVQERAPPSGGAAGNPTGGCSGGVIEGLDHAGR